MNCLHIIHGYNEPFLSLSNQYAKSLQQAGHRVVTVYLTGSDNAQIREQTVADDIFFLDAGKHQLRGMKLGLAFTVAKLIRRFAIECIVAQRYKPIYLGLLGSSIAAFGNSQIPVLGVSHAFGMLKNKGRRRFLNRFSKRLTLVGVSQAVTDDMRMQDKQLRITALANCIDSKHLASGLVDRATARQRFYLADSDFVFANVGRLHADKDQKTLIHAFANIVSEHRNAKLLLIGRGRLADEYHALIESYNLQRQVFLMGGVEQAWRYFTAFDCYVSSSDREPFGIVLTEAMLAKLPIISTDCGGAPEVLGEHALYFRCGEREQLAQQLKAVLAMSEQERTRRSQALNQRLDEKFSFEAFDLRLQALVNEICT